ncbi:MAG: hypothetical protein JSR99_01365 [Proteobacteria bacterium]|nr:hypothetical protein [Pseudomonadota bacterium]
MFGALLNVWVLTVHVTSVALTQLRADGGGVVICHQGSLKYLADADLGSSKLPSKKQCPICSGLAALHVGVISELAMDVLLPTLFEVDVPDVGRVDVADRRLQQIFNRGPPRLA